MRPGFDPIAKTLHWIIAAAIIFMLGLGWIMGGMPNGADKFAAFQLHKSIGITIMLLALVRLAWRWTHRPPALPDDMQRWEKAAAHGGHVLLYMLMIGMPFVGWIIVSCSSLNLPTILFGIVPWPHLPVLPELADKKDIGHLAGTVHGFLAWVIAVVVCIHAGAALKHHFIDRNDVLMRMAPKFLGGLLKRVRGEK
jgi:cytochrome b561